VRSGLISVAQRTTNLLLILTFVWFLGWGVDGALLALSIAMLVSLTLMILDLSINCDFRLVRLGRRHFRPVVSYGLRHYPAGVGNIIDLQLGTLILGLFATREEIGLFAAILTLSLKVLIFSQSLELSTLPRLVASPPEKQLALVGSSIRISLALTMAAMLGLLVLSVPLVSLVLSAKFLPAVPLIWILAPGIVIQGATKVLIAYFRATNRPGIVSLATWVALMVNALITVLFYPIIGVSAAAWAMTIAFGSRAIILFGSYWLLTGQDPVQTLLPRREDLNMIRRSFERSHLRIVSMFQRSER
jgi:O-antigen/teichoic acid export membrane protein